MNPPDPVRAFAASAHAYCCLLDDAVAVARLDPAALQQALVKLLAARLNLPTQEDAVPSAEDAMPPARARLQERDLPKGLLPFDLYWAALEEDIAAPPPGVGCGSLADDVTAVYNDLGAGMSLWDAGRVAEAVGAWELDFVTHTDAHLTSAIHQLQRWLGQNG